MRLDDEQLFRDDLAERRRERDREREPRRFRRRPVERRAVNFTLDSSITAIECPVCLGPVFAAADSPDHGDRIDCAECDARLVTHRAIGGELTAILLPEGAL